jgi:diacylglycerol O-acyltransferase
MSQNHVGDRLAPLDALFLYVEKKEMPLHIGAAFVFDGHLDVADLKSLIQAKLPLIPRYRQRLVFPPLNLGYPIWEFDPDFNLDRHIHHARIRPGTQEQLEKLAGEIFSQIMDRDRPLWDITVVDGLRGSRSALIARVHHCLADGIAGVSLMNLILDQTPEPLLQPAKRRLRTPSAANPGPSLLDAVMNTYSHAAGRLFSMQSAALDVSQELLAELVQGSLAQPVDAVAEIGKPMESFPFKAPCLGPRQVSWADFLMEEIDAVRHVYGAKVNDVCLAILGSAMRRYAQAHRLAVKDRVLRLMVPVNLREPGHNHGLGNRISLIPVSVPLDIRDPEQLVRAVHERTEALKHAHAAGLMVLGGTMLAMLPVPVQALLTGLLSNVVPVLPFDMVCTNVPGPTAPLYLLRRKMLTYHAYVPIGDFMGVCCAMVSYDGTMYFGLTGDSACAPDLGRLRDFLRDAFAELKASAGVPRRAHRKPKPVDAVASRPAAELVSAK